MNYKMKKSYIMPVIAAALLATGCSKEEPFAGSGDASTGQFLKSALAVEVNSDDFTYTRADASVEDFIVVFKREGQEEPAAHFRYGDMPEVVTLPVGKYTCTAYFGQNHEAEWESPYFFGKSQEFAINPLEITSYVEPIECGLENIKVTVDFDQALRERMSADSSVEVKVGSSSALRFGLTEADARKAGYFMHSDEITLVAVFDGKVDGGDIHEVKSLENIRKGAHYKINFKLHQGTDSEFSGDAEIGGLTVDASVDVDDLNRSVSLGQEDLLDDSERPLEGDEPGKDDPKPDDPAQPDDPASPKPTIEAVAPVDLTIVNNGNELESCVLNIHSSHPDGITQLYCDIDSPVLTQEVLQEFTLDTHLDLVDTPEGLQDGLSSLNLPYLVGGEHDVVFDISRFLAILASISEGQENRFVITVGDANGTTVANLRIKF